MKKDTSKQSSMKRHIFMILLLIALLTGGIFGQPDYIMKVSEPGFVSARTYEFDLIIQSTGSDIELTSYQCSFRFNTEIIKGGELNFCYVEGSSELENTPNYSIDCQNVDESPELTLASNAGGDIITSQPILVGKFRIENTVEFNEKDPEVTWDFEGLVKTIITGENFVDITDPSNHIDMLTSVDDENLETPLEYGLSQNYPNPFNPSTTIHFDLKEDSQVLLEVYNMLGQKVADLVQNTLSAGSHEVNFDGSNLASGAYIYRLDVKDKFTDVRRMMLVK